MFWVRTLTEQVKLDNLLLKRSLKKTEKEKAKSEELYILPEGWRWVKLKKMVLRVQYGLSKAMNSEEIGFPVIRMNNITHDGRLDFTDLKFVDVDERVARKYLLKKGDILFNRTNSRELVGKTAVFNQDGDFVFVSYIIRVIADRSRALPEYISAFLNSGIGKQILFRMARPAIQMANINAKELRSIDIPLAPLDVQRRIVARLSELTSRIEKARRIRQTSKEETERIVQSALHEIFSEAEEKGWDLKKLRDFCEVNPSRSEIRDLPDSLEVTFVPMKAVSETTGRIEEPERRLLGKVRQGYTYFREEDVLFAKITPSMENGKSAIARNLVNGLGFGSTEFHVIRTLDDTIPEWIYYFVRQKSFRDVAERNMTGSVGQQRVPKKFIENAKIPLPSPEKQREIVAYLNRVRRQIETLREKQEETETVLERITPAVLDRAFKGEL